MFTNKMVLLFPLAWQPYRVLIFIQLTSLNYIKTNNIAWCAVTLTVRAECRCLNKISHPVCVTLLELMGSGGASWGRAQVFWRSKHQELRRVKSCCCFVFFYTFGIKKRFSFCSDASQANCSNEPLSCWNQLQSVLKSNQSATLLHSL